MVNQSKITNIYEFPPISAEATNIYNIFTNITVSSQIYILARVYGIHNFILDGAVTSFS